MYHKNIFTHQLDYFCCKLNATSWYFHVGDTLQVKRSVETLLSQKLMMLYTKNLGNSPLTHTRKHLKSQLL